MDIWSLGSSVDLPEVSALRCVPHQAESLALIWTCQRMKAIDGCAGLFGFGVFLKTSRRSVAQPEY